MSCPAPNLLWRFWLTCRWKIPMSHLFISLPSSIGFPATDIRFHASSKNVTSIAAGLPQEMSSEPPAPSTTENLAATLAEASLAEYVLPIFALSFRVSEMHDQPYAHAYSSYRNSAKTTRSSRDTLGRPGIRVKRWEAASN